jgi:hypothetical protein
VALERGPSAGLENRLVEMAATPLREGTALIRQEPAPLFSLPRAISHPQWAEDVGERVVWMQQAELKTAHLRLDPPQLGTVEVHIILRETDSEVWFSAPTASVREALETALPRLREMLGQHGLQLGHAGVFDGGRGGNASTFTPPDRPPLPPRITDAVPGRAITLDRPRHGGLFEAYA